MMKKATILISLSVAMTALVLWPDVRMYAYNHQPASSEAVVTAYSSTPDQTDSTPYTTANGKPVRKGIIANNCLPMGAKVYVEGVGELEVQDRMNSRYGCDRYDIWMESREEALEWGKKKLKVTLLE